MDDDLVCGGYVNEPPYLEMRLRMLLTGTANPSNEVWAAALQELLGKLRDDERYRR